MIKFTKFNPKPRSSIKGKLAAAYPAIYERMNQEVHTDFIHPDLEDQAEQHTIYSDTTSATTSSTNPAPLEPSTSDNVKTYVIANDDISEVK